MFLKVFNTSCTSRISPWIFTFQYLPERFIFFLKDVDICNFANDTTTYIFDENIENVFKSFERIFMLVIHWFENNYMKLDIDKLHLIVSSY